jgi:hypothetical protein
MNAIKFACPVCGQHITCDAADSGSQMECPTCFRKLVVPQAPADGTKFILSAAEVGAKKPITEIAPLVTASKPSPRWLPFVWTGLALVVLAGGAVAVVKLRSHHPPAPPPKPVKTNAVDASHRRPPPPVSPEADARWRLDLTGAVTPTNPAIGRILGQEFSVQLATIREGTLSLRQGAGWPPDVGVTILLPKLPARDFARKEFMISTNFPGKTPRVILRTKDTQRQEVTQTVPGGYVMKLEFGAMTNECLPGRLYLCTADDAKSVVAGRFNAEIRKPNPPKTPGSRPRTNAPPKPK